MICTDKTGTLTENQMAVTRLWTAETVCDLNRDVSGGVVPTLAALAAARRNLTAANGAVARDRDAERDLMLLGLVAGYRPRTVAEVLGRHVGVRVMDGLAELRGFWPIDWAEVLAQSGS